MVCVKAPSRFMSPALEISSRPELVIETVPPFVVVMVSVIAKLTPVRSIPPEPKATAVLIVVIPTPAD